MTVDPKIRKVRKPPLSEKETMGMHRKTLTLLLASLCGSGTAVVAQDDFRLESLASTGRIGDSEASITDASHSISDDVQSISDSHQSISDDAETWSDEALDSSDNEFPQVAAHPIGYQGAIGDASQASGSYTMAYKPSNTVASNRGGMGWIQFDNLLWWGRGLTTSPTILGGDAPNVFPTTPIGGGQQFPVGNDLLYGMRADVGFWLDECQNYGVGGRAWGMLSSSQEQIFTNNGNSTGVAFFNTSLNTPDAYLVNVDAGVFGANTGTIGVLSDIDVVSGELYGKALLMGDKNNRTDLIGGYTFLRLDSTYRLQTSVLDGITNAPPPVDTVTTITDQFATTNEFHGGHIGLSTNMNRGRVGFGLSGKVAMGNMQSTSVVSGLFSQVPPAPNLPTTENRGLFAQSSNIGTTTQDLFTFIPELNARLRYQIGRAQLGVGYTFVVLPNVAMGASQVDTNVDVFSIGGPVAPTPKFNTEAFYLHGLDLGLTINF